MLLPIPSIRARNVDMPIMSLKDDFETSEWIRISLNVKLWNDAPKPTKPWTEWEAPEIKKEGRTYEREY